jgi:anti-anti-sigma factor
MRQELEAHLIELSIVDGRPTIRGECDLSTADEIGAWLATFEEEPLEIDLAGVTFFDSTALRMLLMVWRRNPQMRAINPSKAVLKVLEITGTVDIFTCRRARKLQL